MSTLDPLGDFYLPGPAAREDEPEPEAFPLDDRWLEPEADEVDEVGDDATPADDESFDDWAEADEAPLVTGSSADEADAIDELDAGATAAAASATASEETDRRSSRVNLMLALLLLAAMVAVGWYLAQPSTLPIKQVNIEGEFQQLSRAELQQLVTQELHGGFFSMDVGALRNAVTANPWVRDVSVQRVWPDALQVSVREQTAMARWGDSGLVNSNGDYFAPDMSTAPAGIPRLNGPPDSHAQLSRRLQQLREVLAPLQMAVQTLTLSERRAWSFTTKSGLEVVLGREDFDTRLTRFVELVPASLGERLSEARYIDMRYTNGFAVRYQAADSGPPAKGPNKGNGAA